MGLLAIDLGGTKLSSAIFNKDGLIQQKDYTLLAERKGSEIGQLISNNVSRQLLRAKEMNQPIKAIGVSVPGISDSGTNTVWAPNLIGWESYPLYEEIKQICGEIPVSIESDRTCYILGELWKGAAIGCDNAIYLAVGTGIGAGILSGGHLLRGANDIAGAIGWLALAYPFKEKYKNCGHFEYYASGEGIVRLAAEILAEKPSYSGPLRNSAKLTAHHIFEAYEQADEVASLVLHQCITYWGMAVANLVSLFNPQQLIIGGGVFGPAAPLIPAIYEEAKRWSQPISIRRCKVQHSTLGSDAGLFGAAYAALKITQNSHA